jgi:hypothetical protein
MGLRSLYGLVFAVMLLVQGWLLATTAVASLAIQLTDLKLGPKQQGIGYHLQPVVDQHDLRSFAPVRWAMRLLPAN